MSVKERYSNISPLSKDIKEKINNLIFIFEKNKVKLAYLFGSVLYKEVPEDVDIGVFFEGDYFELLKELKEYLNTERIDLIDLSQVSPFQILHIIKTGKLIYKESNKTENLYELKILKLCQDLETLRKKQIEVLKRSSL
ncbi:MAG: nucleotidyltransferase domain-containing protein [Dictyoglomaceae bacterium]|nr:nucleotidyltransferase domain-containing protein [Dictyoglomaceae bacterium]